MKYRIQEYQFANRDSIWCVQYQKSFLWFKYWVTVKDGSEEFEWDRSFATKEKAMAFIQAKIDHSPISIKIHNV